MAIEALAAISGLAGLGAVAGSQPAKSQQTNTTLLRPQSQGEFDAIQSRDRNLSFLRDILGESSSAGRDKELQRLQFQEGENLSNLLRQMGSRSGLPSQEQTAAAGQFAQDVFAPEKVQLEQLFRKQEEEKNQLAAQLGRNVDDPVLNAMLARDQGELQSQLGARQTSFASQFAQQLPQQQLALAQGLFQLRGGLASQAMANRQLLLGLGQNVAQAEQQFRAGTATQVGQNVSGGGVRGAMMGAIGGATAGADALAAFKQG